MAQTVTFRLSEAEEENAPHPEEHEPVNTEKLLEALTAYTLSDPEAKPFAQTLASVGYRETGEDEFTIELPHQGLMRSFEAHLIRFLPFVRRFLHNDRLMLKLSVKAETGPRKDRGEVFRERMAANPVLDKFLNSGDFTVS